MTKCLLKCVLVLAVLSSAPTFGAEGIQLNPVVSIYADGKGDGLKLPQGTACNDQMLFAADTGNGRILKFNMQDRTLIFEKEIKLSQLLSPTRLQLNSKGVVFALDEKQRRIVSIGPDGAFVGFVSPQGLPAPDEFVPRSFKIDEHDNIYILDIFSERVLVLDATGKFLRAIKFPADYGFVSDIAVDSSGTVFLLDTAKCMLYSASGNAAMFTALTGQLKEYMLFPTYLTIDKTGTIFIVDQNGGAIAILSKNGQVQGKQLSKGWREGLLRYPSQMCLTDKGDVFIADRENNRIQVFAVKVTK